MRFGEALRCRALGLEFGEQPRVLGAQALALPEPLAEPLALPGPLSFPLALAVTLAEPVAAALALPEALPALACSAMCER